MSAESIKKEVSDRWANEPIVKLCSTIIDYISSLPKDQAKMLTFSTLSRAVGKEQIDEELLRAITILVSSRIAALDPHALLVDENEDEHEVDISELAKARRNGVLIHPETGKPVQEFESKIIPFFVPSERFWKESE